MLTYTKVAQILSGDEWDARKRNTVARRFASQRNMGGDIIRTVHRIATNGPVGRYDRLRAQLLKIVAEASGCAAVIKSEHYHYQGRRLRYSVDIFGVDTDVERAINLYEELAEIAVHRADGISGDNVASRRRATMNDFLRQTTERLRDVGRMPSLEFIHAHHEAASAVLDGSPAKWLRV